MRLRTLCAAALALSAAVGGAAQADEIAAPPGAEPLVEAFFSVCGPAMTDMEAGRRAAVAAGWTNARAPGDPIYPPHLGRFDVYTVETGAGAYAAYTFVEAVFPHLRTQSCSYQLVRDPDHAINIPVLSQTPGFEGGFGGLGDSGAGRWSRELDGDVVTLDALNDPGHVSQLTLMRAHRVEP